jgi:hypothetical protein
LEVQDMLDSYKELRESDYLNETEAGIDMDVEDCRDINERIFAGFIKDTMIKAFDPAEVTVEVVLDTDSTIQQDEVRISYDPNQTYEDPRLRTSKWYETRITGNLGQNAAVDVEED